jgi:ATP-binding cassette subfamily B protein
LGVVFTGRAIDNILRPGQVLDLRGRTVLSGAAGNFWCCWQQPAQWVMNVCTRKISSRASNDMRGEAFRVLNRTPLKYSSTATRTATSSAEWSTMRIL